MITCCSRVHSARPARQSSVGMTRSRRRLPARVVHEEEEVVLARHVAVEGHRREAETFGDALHRDGAEALGVRDLDATLHDALEAQPQPGLAVELLAPPEALDAGRRPAAHVCLPARCVEYTRNVLDKSCVQHILPVYMIHKTGRLLGKAARNQGERDVTQYHSQGPCRLHRAPRARLRRPPVAHDRRLGGGHRRRRAQPEFAAGQRPHVRRWSSTASSPTARSG